ncbi:hypothetical protein TNCV_3974571 [Trichonephila clavipes]|nr:hypothetical protein TNCV_3974571 [Trichonephila clavipes]
MEIDVNIKVILLRTNPIFMVSNSPRATEFWAFHPRSATFNLHCPVPRKHLRYPLSLPVESRVLELVLVHL